jgi:hypothetical protein
MHFLLFHPLELTPIDPARPWPREQPFIVLTKFVSALLAKEFATLAKPISGVAALASRIFSNSSGGK